MNAPIPTFTEEDQEFSNQEIKAFKDYIVSRLRAAKATEVGKETNHVVGMLLGAIAAATGDFIGYTMGSPQATLDGFNVLMMQSALVGQLDRIVEDHPTDTAP
jgi:hypothetical protein